jgi:hypothetical protein
MGVVSVHKAIVINIFTKHFNERDFFKKFLFTPFTVFDAPARHVYGNRVKNDIKKSLN